VLAHRVIVTPESDFAGVRPEKIVERALAGITPPAYRAAEPATV
jgi:MoxR-like ATPase